MILKFSSPFRFIAAILRGLAAKLLGYRVLAPVDVWDKRLDECMNCEELVEETQQCAICTCDVDAKSSLALEQCPKNKWQRVWIRHTIK